MKKTFPSDFVWGAASANYQVEGGAYDDGKGLAIWDVFCRREGATLNGENGDVACDHYHRYAEDVALMKQMALQGYRFSVCWSRILPDGVGAVNPKGLDFYSRLIDCLLEVGIEPWVNICHFDLPHELFLRGGWLNPDISNWFADYTRILVENFSDRVRNWFTFNEPNVMVIKGYYRGDHAPGLKLPLYQCLLAAHNILLSHGKCVATARAATKRPIRIGLAGAAFKCAPLTETPADIEAARKMMYAPVPGCVQNPCWWTDPIFYGKYPEESVVANGRDMPRFSDSDMKIISQPTDHLGFNCYGGALISAGPDGQPVIYKFPAGYPATTMDWELTPQVIYWASRFHHERFHTPIVIAENGLAGADWVSLDGRVHDPQRIDYMKRYLRAVHRLITDGIPVPAYFHWTITDSFEWSLGYSKRFGLIHIDYQTQKRTMKDSAHFYRDVIKSKGARLFDDSPWQAP